MKETHNVKTAAGRHTVLCLLINLVNVAADGTGQINQFDQSGLFGYTNIYNPAQRQQFHRFSVP